MTGDSLIIALRFASIETIACIYATSVIALYDILITFDLEVACIWSRQFSVMTLLFASMRYGSVLVKVFNIAGYAQPGIAMPCKIIAFTADALVVLNYMAQSIFMSLRTWAIWQRRWVVLAIFLPASLLPIVANLYEYSKTQLDPRTGRVLSEGCIWDVQISHDLYARGSIISRCYTTIFELAVLIATWIKTWSIRRHLRVIAQVNVQPQVPLTDMLLRDGTIYFVALLFLNVMVIIFASTPNVNPSLYFVDTVTSCLLCRFILNLRSHDMIDDYSVALTTAKQSATLYFAHDTQSRSEVGNVGESVSGAGAAISYREDSGDEGSVADG